MRSFPASLLGLIVVRAWAWLAGLIVPDGCLGFLNERVRKSLMPVAVKIR